MGIGAAGPGPASTATSRYASVFSLGSGAHFCIGALLDGAGDDRYEGYGDSHTGLAFGHDFTIAIFHDAAGDDQYRFGADGVGHAINMSLALFTDSAGNDTYVLDRGKEGFGITNFAPADLDPPPARNYLVHATQVGLFLDAAGEDAYLERDPESGAESRSSVRKDGARILRPASPAREAGGRHAGVFVDRR